MAYLSYQNVLELALLLMFDTEGRFKVNHTTRLISIMLAIKTIDFRVTLFFLISFVISVKFLNFSETQFLDLESGDYRKNFAGSLFIVFIYTVFTCMFICSWK